MNVESLGHNRPRGIASAAGVCTCEGAHSRRCSCMPPPPPPPPDNEDVDDEIDEESFTNGRQPALVTGPLSESDVDIKSSTGKNRFVLIKN